MSQLRLQPLTWTITVPLHGRRFYRALSINLGGVAQHPSFGDMDNVSSSPPLEVWLLKKL